MSGSKITDFDAWRRVCLQAFENLSSDTDVTMAQVDAALLAGARRYAGEPMGDEELAAWMEEIATTVGAEMLDVDAILCWCAADAAKLLTDPAAGEAYRSALGGLPDVLGEDRGCVHQKRGPGHARPDPRDTDQGSEGSAVSTLHERLLAATAYRSNRSASVALRAVVELHREASDVPLCVECWNGSSEDYHAWPCQTIRSIAEALGVEVDGG